MYLYQTGRERAISLAEIESLLGSGASMRSVGHHFVMVNELLPLMLMGGTVKIAQVITTLDTLDPQAIKKAILKLPPTKLVSGSDDTKYNLGVSSYGIDFNAQQLTGIGLELKKLYKKQSSPLRLRIVPSKDQQLSNAQVLHNKLHRRDQGAEIILVRDGSKTHLAVTVDTQDLDAYAARDQARPARDTYVGMLPPKLAQIILNLAVGRLRDRRLKMGDENPAVQSPRLTVLDPFCGTGVVLQEAVRAGFRAYGSDISPSMVKASQENLEWYIDKYGSESSFRIETGDATTHTWKPPIDVVASEIFLGEPLSSAPSPQKLEPLVAQSKQLLTKFLVNIQPQLETGTRLCVAVPAWRTTTGFTPSLSVDDLKELGYNAVSFNFIDEELVYIRDNQVTGRRLLVLTKE